MTAGVVTAGVVTAGAVVVTGGARGIGRAVAEELATRGEDVVTLDVRASGRAPGFDAPGRLVEIRCDITSEAEVRQAMDHAADTVGAPTRLVNNAGITSFFDPAELSEQEWDSVFGVDLKSAWLCAKHAIPHMKRAGAGAIVNVSSIHARLTLEGMFPYAAAKAGVEGLTRSLALDLAPHGIRVNAVAPGYVSTEMSRDWIERQPDPAEATAAVGRSIPLGRMATPREIAGPVAFLLSAEAAAITGAVLAVDCGLGARFAT